MASGLLGLGCDPVSPARAGSATDASDGGMPIRRRPSQKLIARRLLVCSRITVDSTVRQLRGSSLPVGALGQGGSTRRECFEVLVEPRLAQALASFLCR